MTKRIKFTLLVLFTVLLAACSSGNDAVDSQSMSAPAEEPAAGFYSPELSMDMAMDEEMFKGESGVRASTVSNTVGSQLDRVIIKNGWLDIVVADSEDAAEEIARLAESYDGWIVSSNLYMSNSYKAGRVTLRVPSESFDAVVADIKEMATEVRDDSFDSSDVTEEFVDLTARLENLEATAERVRNFLDSAKNVEEALAVNRELSRLEGEIESYKGRLKYLDQSSTYAFLSVQLTPDELAQPLEIGGWKPKGVAREALQALVNAFQSIGTAIIWLGVFLLPLMILLVLAVLVLRSLWRRRSGRTAEG